MYKYSKTCHKQNRVIVETCLQGKTFTVHCILCKNHYETTFNECDTTQTGGKDKASVEYSSCLNLILFSAVLSAWPYPSIVCCLSAVRSAVRKCTRPDELGEGLDWRLPKSWVSTTTVYEIVYGTSPNLLVYCSRTQCHFRIGSSIFVWSSQGHTVGKSKPHSFTPQIVVSLKCF